MKYIIIAVVIIVSGLGFYSYKSSQASKAEYAQKMADYEKQQLMSVKVSELKSKIDLRDQDALKLIQSAKLTVEDATFYEKINEKWQDAIKVAGATARINLNQSVDGLQQIKRELSEKVTSSDCDSMSKDTLLLAYDKTIDSYLSFMQNKETEASLNQSSSDQVMAEANKILSYCKSASGT
ncbi:hypothetical protein [Acinetobacter sp. MD2(2019)]|uniref:hypothetical protein n=1 Tax=Acinetobacter sp. MD2(2019) TaxID=2605273 RepID=UPI002D1E5684|nr:hypothetical protein [Acinetobacter sp. MD2(2019)]MEB3753817.1 hypothetical protein [Acinetobacter sp. MD2(2019)]